MIIFNRKKGQGVVEMALVLPIFFFVIMGIYDFGRAMHVWSSLHTQCVSAARVASKRINQLVARDVYTSTTHQTLAEVQTAFWAARSPMTPQSEITATFEGVGTTQQKVSVSASYNLSLVTPIFGTLIGAAQGEGSASGAITLRARADENKE
ncbi:pilus assembly protein [bacterium]|nr:pilus assembly protein [bacterium]